MLVDHLGNYRRALPLGLLFALVSIGAAAVFVVYAAKWNDVETKTNTNGETDQAYLERTRTEYAYYATVITLLVLLVFFNGYHLTKL